MIFKRPGNHILYLLNLFAVSACLLTSPVPAYAEDVPQEAIDQLTKTVGNRVEAITIIGGDNGAVGGLYDFKTKDKISINTTKLGGSGIVADPMRLGIGNMKWAPVLKGNLGYMEADYRYETGYLEGNDNSYKYYSIEAGGGARFYFTDNLSTAPVVCFIYSQIKTDFTSRNTNGQNIENQYSGIYVDWHMNTISFVPSIDLDYVFYLKRNSFEFNSRYNFYHTKGYSSSDTKISVDGNSSSWDNRLDADVPLVMKIFGRELHTGGFFQYTQLFGDAAEGLHENHICTVNARLVLDFIGVIYKTRWIGIGTSYFWGDSLTGWAVGAEVRLKF